MNKRSWIIFGAIVLVVVGGMFYLSTRNKLDVSDLGTNASGMVLEPEERSGNIGDHVFGATDSKVLLIEYGDFQCNPGCRQFHENFTPIMQDEGYKSKITFVYRNFPITSLHPNTIAAASTAEASGLMGKYWEMWDVLFTNQAEWSAASASERTQLFESYATGLGLNLEEFRTHYQSQEVSKKISFDRALGAAANVTGTPTLFLNGEQVENSKITSTESIKQLIDDALKS